MDTASELVVPGLGDQDIALLPNARNYEYYCDMIEQIKKRECPFCDPMDPEKNTAIKSFGGWRIWECPAAFRAADIARHYVVAPTRHFTHVIDMRTNDWCDLGALIEWAGGEA